jgi:hypothetical protein
MELSCASFVEQTSHRVWDWVDEKGEAAAG